MKSKLEIWSTKLLYDKMKWNIVPSEIICMDITSRNEVTIELCVGKNTPQRIQRYIFTDIANKVQELMYKMHNQEIEYWFYNQSNCHMRFEITEDMFSPEWTIAVKNHMKAKSFLAGAELASSDFHNQGYEETPESEFANICYDNHYDYEQFCAGYKNETEVINNNCSDNG